MNFQVLADLADGRLGVVDTTCPLCSHQRHRQNQRKRILRLWVDTDAITFCCVHCGAKGYALADRRGKFTQADRERFRQRRADAAKHEAEDRRKRSEIARNIWARAVDPRGTVAEDYLHLRGLTLPADLAGTELRFHPGVPWYFDPDHPDYPGGWHPSLLAPFRSIETDEITGIHRIRLDRPQRWPKTLRKMLGPVAGSAVKLADVEGVLAVAEGIESALAANQMGFGPAWALGCADAVASLPVLEGVSELVLLRENDAASRDATARCAARWRQAGREVFYVEPDHGSDLNDELMLTSGGR